RIHFLLFLSPLSHPTLLFSPYTTLFRSLVRAFHSNDAVRADNFHAADIARIKIGKQSQPPLRLLFGIESVAFKDENVGEDAHRRSEEHTSELQSRFDIVCCLLLEKKKLV